MTYRRSRRGNAVLEFALAFSFLFPMFYGTFQFGYAFFTFNALRSGVRQGARYASIRAYTAANSTVPAAYRDAVRNMTVYGNTSGTGNPIVHGLTPSNVNVEVIFANNIPARVIVSIQNFSLNAVFRTFVISKPVSSFPYTGRYAPEGV